MGDLEFLFLLLVAAAVLVRVADAISIPYPIVLVLGGLAVGFVPGLPDVELAPDVIFLVFLPPLLHAAGWTTSPQELRAEVAPVSAMAVVLVAVTTASVAVVAHATVAHMSWEAAVILGAVVAPTDSVAALATYARIGVPARIQLLVEGEAMLNDAAALVAYRVAVAAAVSGGFSIAGASWDFVTAAVGGTAVGLVVGWASRHVIRRLNDPPLSIFVSVLTAYLGYIVAEELDVSGVLGAVVSGVYGGWFAPTTLDADTRLSAYAFWEVLVFGLNATLFILLGLQFPDQLDALRDQLSLGALAGAGIAVSLTVIAARVGFLLLPIRGLGADVNHRLAMGWTGMRGAISLAAALAVPRAVDERPEILFLTVVVIFATLVGQGLTLPAALRLLRVQGERQWSPDEAIARLEAAQSALDRLDELEDEGATEEQLRRLRELYRARFRQCQAVLAGDPGAQSASNEPRLRYGQLRSELIGVERAALLGLRNDGRLRAETLSVIQRDLDLEEARLRTA